MCNAQLSFALLAYLTRFLWRPTVVKRVCESELDKLNMKGWFRTIVTDGGSNVKGAFDRAGGWDWLRCACHVLHNVVCAGLTWVQRMGEPHPQSPAGRMHRALSR